MASFRRLLFSLLLFQRSHAIFFDLWRPVYTYVHGGERELNVAYLKLMKFCTRNIAPWSKHPFGIIDREAFHKAYTEWNNRIYHGLTSLTMHHHFGVKNGDYWSHWYVNPACESLPSDENKLEQSLPTGFVKMLRLYGYRESMICKDVAGIIKHLAHFKGLEFNLTDDTYMVDFHVKPVHKSWDPLYFTTLYHASAFSTCFTPVVLTVILLIKHPKLFAFFFRL
uniref:Minor glycoprotein n=1 Tax=Kibale red colobus virus 2 TaxID=1936072 RepID=X2D5C1_9NIDO|nr:minor glycoprotein [Kibale red colobus virus 2]